MRDSTIRPKSSCRWANQASDTHRDEDNLFARGHAFGEDDIASPTRYVEYPAKTLFLVWVTLNEQKWAIFGLFRNFGAGRASNNVY